MNTNFKSPRLFGTLSGISAMAGVFMLIISFLINPGPPPNATLDQLAAFARQNFRTVLWGGWLQAVGPVFIVLFSLSIVYLSDSVRRLTGMMTLFGASTLMTVSMIEITFYICALFKEPTMMGPVGIALISSVQHLYFIVAAPVFFIPLGSVILGSDILPHWLGISAIAIGLIFAFLGMISLLDLTLPLMVTACGGIQVFWWLSASIVLILRAGKISLPPSNLH
jgi:hypothetical protein